MKADASAYWAATWVVTREMLPEISDLTSYITENYQTWFSEIQAKLRWKLSKSFTKRKERNLERNKVEK